MKTPTAIAWKAQQFPPPPEFQAPDNGQLDRNGAVMIFKRI